MVKKVEQLNPELEARYSEVSLSLYGDDDGDSYTTTQPARSGVSHMLN